MRFNEDKKVSKLESPVAKVIVIYENGATKEVNKGMVVEMKPYSEDESQMGVQFCQMTRGEGADLLIGVSRFAEDFIRETAFNNILSDLEKMFERNED